MSEVKTSLMASLSSHQLTVSGWMLLLCLQLAACTGLFSGVFRQDDPTLIVPVEALYRLPLHGSRQTFLLVQGIGGHFSHQGDQTWAFDWAMPTGTPVVAARGGVVESVRSEPDDRSAALENRRANYVRVRHVDGSIGVYAHLDTTSIRPGTRVSAGDTLGWSGNTGYSTQPHLHFHVEKNGASIPCAFTDAGDEGGVPRAGRLYRGSWGR